MGKPVNPKGVVSFEATGGDGKRRRFTLAFDVNAIIEAEDAFDCGINQVALKLAGGMDLPKVTAEAEKALAGSKLDQATRGEVMTSLAPFLEWVAQSTAGDGGTRFKHLRTLFRCALVGDVPTMTDAEAGALMTQIGPQEAGALVTSAFGLAFHKDAPADNPTPPAG